MTLSVVFTLFVLLLTVPGMRGNFHYSRIHKDREVDLKPINNQIEESILSCSQRCSELKKCVSLSFNSISKECLLYKDYITDSTRTSEKVGEMILSVRYEFQHRPLSIMSAEGSSETPAYPAINVVNVNMTSCFMTEALDFEPWLLVDLGDVYTISDVIVHTSDDLYVQQRFHDVNFELYSVDPRLNPEVKGLCCGSTEGLSASRVVIVRCSCDVAGRFVKIYIEKSEKLTICHVQVLTGRDVNYCLYKKPSVCKKVPRGPNIADNKTSSLQKSMLPGDSSLFPVDNMRNTCSNVRYYQNKYTTVWWYINLKNIYNITSITIANEEDIKSKDMKDLDVYHLNKHILYMSAIFTLCKHFDGYFGATIRTFECDEVAISQHMVIQKNSNHLRLCTVEITGQLVN